MDKYLFSEMAWPEVKEAVDKGYLAVIPVGSLEQHGKHLPLNVDYFLCERVVHQVARMLNRVVVLPTVVYGRSAHHLPFCGTVSLKTDTYINLIYDILDSLTHHGFRKIVIINGHGGNRGALATAVGKFMEEGNGSPQIYLCNYYSFAADRIKEIRESEIGGMAHAGEYETSLSLYLQEKLVEMEKAVKRIPRSPIPEYIYADLLGDSSVSLSITSREEDRAFYEYTFSESGVAGDPTLASQEKGEMIYKYVVEDMVRFFKLILERKAGE